MEGREGRWVGRVCGMPDASHVPLRSLLSPPACSYGTCRPVHADHAAGSGVTPSNTQ
mgnify:CR=1 FL=1